MVTLKVCFLLLASSELAFGAAPGARYRRRDSAPANPYDKDTTKYCTWWLDYNEELPCDQVLKANSITLEEFRRWNPSITGNCGGMTVGKSYCVEATFEPTPTASPTGPSGPTGTPGTIETPLPTQPEIAPNCDAFHLVKQGEDCSTISATYGITGAQFLAWNPSAGKDCTGLWANAYACVSIVGHEPSKTTSPAPQPTPTKPSNGIETPLPTQPKIVDNCDKFHLVQSGENCAAIASKYGISLAQFTQWNSAAGSNCEGLWANAYACVSIIGHEPMSTPTKPSNGIETPLPTQPEIVNNCNKFYLVQSGDTCTTIVSKYGITLSDFTKWNPKAGNTCAGLWANAYACVSVIGYTPKPSPTPTPTKPPNGIQTPTPIQNGMVTNCNKFHFVETGNTCPVIQAKYKVTLADLVKWNPAIKADCTGLWAKSYLCVGTL
ncbi:LysM domain-containing protein [Trichophyton mentagrophytes]|nr:LysM domain-containing protein [Trichophyton mentagrophytes]